MSTDDPTVKLSSDQFFEQVREMTAPLYAFDKRLRQFETQVATISKIEEQVSALDKKVDERLHETRPVWQGVLAEVREFREQAETEALELRKRFDTIVLEAFETRVKQREIERRLELLEAHKKAK